LFWLFFPAWQTQHGGVYANGDLRSLKIRASNEYGEFDQVNICKHANNPTTIYYFDPLEYA